MKCKISLLGLIRGDTITQKKLAGFGERLKSTFADDNRVYICRNALQLPGYLYDLYAIGTNC